MTQRFEFRMPDIGEGISEGEIVSWLVEAGDEVQEDTPIVEVMTDKATVTIGSPRAGRIAELCCPEGKIAAVGEVILVIETEASGEKHQEIFPPAAPSNENSPARREAALLSEAKPSHSESARDEAPSATAVGDLKVGLPGIYLFTQRNRAWKSGGNGDLPSLATLSGPRRASQRPLATPATRRLARRMGIDLREITATGPGGRVTSEDVRGHGMALPEEAVHAKGNEPYRNFPGPREPQSSKAKVRSREPIDFPEGVDELRRPLQGIRRTIAERMARSKQTAAHFTFVEECEVDRLVELRERLRPAAREHGIDLSFLPFIMKAVVEALKRQPLLNASLDDQRREIVYHRRFHLGLAAATPDGLVVPVVRDVDQRSILELAREIERLANAAREGRLSPRELGGSTFTVTSLGKRGGLLATPVLNWPEVGILGVHRIRKRPVVRDDRIEIGQVMTLSLSFDHRIIDGDVGASFAYDIIERLEDPGRLLLEI